MKMACMFQRGGVRLLLALCLAATAVFSTFVVPPRALAEGAFVVNSEADTNVRDSVLTLREAIMVANGDLATGFTAAERGKLGGCIFSGTAITGGCGASVRDRITFTVPQVKLRTLLPEIRETAIIDGGSGRTRLDGSALAWGDGLRVVGSNVVLVRLAIINIAADSAAIRITNGVRVRVVSNFLGTLPGATSCTPTGVTRTGAYGVYVRNLLRTQDVRAWIYGNVIGCHVVDGVHITDTARVYVGEDAGGRPSPNYIGVNTGGATLPNKSNGVVLTSAGVNPTQDNVVRANVIKNNGQNGVRIRGVGPNYPFFAAGNKVFGNVVSNNHAAGVLVEQDANENLIGTSNEPLQAATSNMVASNGRGVVVQNAHRNLIVGNLIGVNRDEVVAGNLGVGVTLSGASGTKVVANVISGNRQSGVVVHNASDNQIYGNRIGTNLAGQSARANGGSGVVLQSGAVDNMIGADDPGFGNVISGNALHGVVIRDAATRGNRLTQNFIGTSYAGTFAIPNRGNGVTVVGTTALNAIGQNLTGMSTDPTSREKMQLIAGNLGSGVAIVNAAYTYVGPTTWVGFQADGKSALPNGRYGVTLSNASHIGVSAHVAHNKLAGIGVGGDSSKANLITPLEAHHNGGLPIDLALDGPTANDPGDVDAGPNTRLNYPLVKSASGAQISGTACSACRVHIYRAVANPRVAGGGGVYVQTAVADSGGNWGTLLPTGMTATSITMIAQDVDGNTSEMSPRP